MNDTKLLKYLQESLRDKNKSIKELTEYVSILTTINKRFKNIIEVLTLLLILSVIGNVFLLFINFIY